MSKYLDEHDARQAARRDYALGRYDGEMYDRHSWNDPEQKGER